MARTKTDSKSAKWKSDGFLFLYLPKLAIPPSSTFTPYRMLDVSLAGILPLLSSASHVLCMVVYTLSSPYPTKHSICCCWRYFSEVEKNAVRWRALEQGNRRLLYCFLLKFTPTACRAMLALAVCAFDEFRLVLGRPLPGRVRPGTKAATVLTVWAVCEYVPQSLALCVKLQSAFPAELYDMVDLTIKDERR
jgi:hypothetical protein